MNKNRNRPILLLGSYGRGNIGDEAFLAAAKQLFPERIIYINCSSQHLLSVENDNRFILIPTRITSGILKKIKMLFTIRSIVYWGGDVWVELYGDRVPRINLYRMVLVNAIGRLMGKKISYIGCGIGNITGFSLYLARLSSKMAHNIIVRESRTKKILALKGTRLLPDITLNLPYYEGRSHSDAYSGKVNIGLSVLYHIPDADAKFSSFFEQLTSALGKLPKEKIKIILLPMLMTNQIVHDDIWVASIFSNRLNELGYDVEIYAEPSIKEFISKIRSLHLVVGTRLHANILASFSGVPTVGISYRPKVLSFFRDNGIERNCIELDQLELLPGIIEKIISDYTRVSEEYRRVSVKNLAFRSEYENLTDSI